MIRPSLLPPLFASLLLGLAMAGCQSTETAPVGKTRPKTTTSAPSTTTEEPAPVEASKPAVDEIALAAADRRVPVIMYHDIVDRRRRGSVWFDCSAEEFEAQMARISELGYQPISLADLYAHLSEGATIPAKAIVLTFDDNYQGFYDHAWPILKQYGYPAAMFVHTNFVGDTKGPHPKMTWKTLQELSQDPLFTVGSHTVMHHLDLGQRPADEQKTELELSKSTLEAKLGKTMETVAYPNGSNSEETRLLARGAGYKMAFTTVNTPAEESPGLFAIGRYVHTRLEKAIADAEAASLNAPAAIFRATFADSPVSFERVDSDGGVPISLVKGGHPKTMMSKGRETVRDFVKRGKGVAGINGGFFAMAAIRSTDNQMVGPLKTPDLPATIPDNARERWGKLLNRPVVMWSKEEMAIVPYNPATMRDPDAFEYLVPGVTDVFLAGVWLVHGGVAQVREQQNAYGSGDIQDARRRAAIGMTSDGRFVAAAAAGSISSERFAEALAMAGVSEAVLLDSGFSTSLVFDGKIKVSGHSARGNPSRPVPHAVVITGTKDPASVDKIDLGSSAPSEPRRKRRRR